MSHGSYYYLYFYILYLVLQSKYHVFLNQDVITSQPERDNNTSNVSSVSNKQETATDSPPTYNEAMEERQSQDSTKPNETTALNSGDKVGYTPGSSAI